MAGAAQVYGIPLQILYSVALTETGSGGTLNPYDMNVRTVAFAAVALAAIVGLATRIVIANSGGPPVQFAGTKSLDLRVGQSFGCRLVMRLSMGSTRTTFYAFV